MNRDEQKLETRLLKTLSKRRPDVKGLVVVGWYKFRGVDMPLYDCPPYVSAGLRRLNKIEEVTK